MDPDTLSVARYSPPLITCVDGASTEPLCLGRRMVPSAQVAVPATAGGRRRPRGGWQNITARRCARRAAMRAMAVLWSSSRHSVEGRPDGVKALSSSPPPVSSSVWSATSISWRYQESISSALEKPNVRVDLAVRMVADPPPAVDPPVPGRRQHRRSACLGLFVVLQGVNLGQNRAKCEMKRKATGPHLAGMPT